MILSLYFIFLGYDLTATNGNIHEKQIEITCIFSILPPFFFIVRSNCNRIGFSIVFYQNARNRSGLTWSIWKSNFSIFLWGKGTDSYWNFWEIRISWTFERDWSMRGSKWQNTMFWITMVDGTRCYGIWLCANTIDYWWERIRTTRSTKISRDAPTGPTCCSVRMANWSSILPVRFSLLVILSSNLLLFYAFPFFLFFLFRDYRMIKHLIIIVTRISL